MIRWLPIFFLLTGPAWATELTVGDPVPSIAFTDIEETDVHSNEYADRIRVFTFADKDSSERLMAWMNDAGLEAHKQFPDLRIAFLNFADVSNVPRLFRGIVEPILRRINNNSRDDLAELYADAGLSLASAPTVFHLAPDWTGDLKQSFGIQDTSRYYCWIAYGDQIIATIHEPTDDPESTYLNTLARISAMMPVTGSNPATSTAKEATRATEPL